MSGFSFLGGFSGSPADFWDVPWTKDLLPSGGQEAHGRAVGRADCVPYRLGCASPLHEPWPDLTYLHLLKNTFCFLQLVLKEIYHWTYGCLCQVAEANGSIPF